jgi:CRISPR/Cas system CSM-associated protein Csm2 small subunit
MPQERYIRINKEGIMGILSKAGNALLETFVAKNEPIFMKEFTKESHQLNSLIELSSKLKKGHKKELIDRDIIYLKAGINGESRVNYEIQNSFLPLICLHDIRIENNGHVAQLDFVIITSKYICVLETKKLYGDISINRDGDFIRSMKGKNGRIHKEGMYSPISQNERHLRILHDMLKSNRIIKKMPLKSLVVMANEKSIINKKGCPAYISKAIYKHDQIVPYLKRNLNDKNNTMNVIRMNMVRMANFLIENNKPIEFDNIAKYGITYDDYLENGVKTDSVIEKNVVKESSSKVVKERNNNVVKASSNKVVKERNNKAVKENSNSNESICNELKKYRFNKAREEGVKPYYIFTNKVMEELIEKRPKKAEDILGIKGFGKVKTEKYGKDIIGILNKYTY